MANTIRLKRGLSNNVTSASLIEGELALTTDTLELYTNNGTENVKLTQKGESGVYIGETEPTDPDVNVWIDTTGESDIVTTPPYEIRDTFALNLSWMEDEGISQAVGGLEGYMEWLNTLKKDSRMSVVNADGTIKMPCYNISLYDGGDGANKSISWYFEAPGSPTMAVSCQVNYVIENGVGKFMAFQTMDYNIRYGSTEYYTPKNWCIIGEEEKATDPNTLYFIVPYYRVANANIHLSVQGIPSTMTLDQIGFVFASETYDELAAFRGYSFVPPADGETEDFQMDIQLPKYTAVKPGVNAYFSGDPGEVKLYGNVIFSNPDTTVTEYWYDGTFGDDETLEPYMDYFLDPDNSSQSPYANFGATNFTPRIRVTLGGPVACLDENEHIKLAEGTKAIKDLKVGDKVIDETGNETVITKVHHHPTKSIYHIMTTKGMIKATFDHKFKIKDKIIHSCQLDKGIKLLDDCMVIKSIGTKEETEVYEILTESGTYKLKNGIICACEEI